MKLISWNVNGLRAIYKKGFKDFFHSINADAFCIQETKMQEGQLEIELEGYEKYFNYAERKGYSGTAIFTKNIPLKVTYGIGEKEFDTEGRVITLEFNKFFLVNCYTPNSGRELARLKYRQIWEERFKKYIQTLDKIKPIILCGDLNVAHQEIDLKNPKSNRGNAGFTDEERQKMTELLAAGFIDTYREMNPDRTDAYSWWSYMGHTRERNVGWRIDYFIISDRINKDIKETQIYSEVMGSDHCPVGLEINL